MAAATLSLAFFLSGAAALVFETLWLRQAGLMLGSTVWASSAVLAAFMAGLALGNAIAVRWAARVARTLRAYALLELGVGVAATLAVIGAPALGPALAPPFRALGGAGAATNAVRFLVAFALVLAPTTAMGMTLPVLARALSRERADFGRVLGRLYGWNTLGGVLGAVGGELWLIGPLGVRGTALAAGALNGLAAALAGLLAWRTRAGGAAADAAASAAGATAERSPLGGPARRLLATTFVLGAALLALEVIWFRFLQLFLFGTSLAFAVMLAVVLLGVGAGGLVASLWLRRDPRAHRWLPAVAAAAGLATIVSYASFSPSAGDGGGTFFISQPGATLALSLRLMLAPSLASGVLFPLVGAALRYELRGAGEAAGWLALANTIGSTIGALLAGFVLLPALGMERSMFAIGLAYAAAVALGAPGRDVARAPSRWPWVWRTSFAALLVGLVAFPRGAMEARHVKTSLGRFLDEGTRIVALREGVNQTTTLLRSEWLGETVSHRLVTNGHSMSGTAFADRRYMKMFVHWAMAVNPRIQRALLISYGLGSTAKALTDTRALARIDVVDISREILDLAGVVFASSEIPLRDPRVRVHVEDGRFFLQTTAERFDLITGEPPPPKAAGIVNLYSREYFRLVHDRLAAGGIATYWLPVEELDEDDARAIVAAFCDAFADCSLWTGAGAHWMLAGTRELREAPGDDAFTAQWRDASVGPELVAIGLDDPEQLGAAFLADAAQLAPWIAGVPALDDDHPQRVSPRRPQPARQDFIERWMDVEPAAARFEGSRWVRALWPASLRARTRERFATQRLVNAVTATPPRPTTLEDLRDVLRESRLVTLPLLMADSSPALQQIAARVSTRGITSATVEAQLGTGALAHRDYAAAATRFARAAAAHDGADALRARIYQAFALLMTDDTARARTILAGIPAAPPASPETQRDLRWLRAMLEEPSKP